MFAPKRTKRKQKYSDDFDVYFVILSPKGQAVCSLLTHSLSVHTGTVQAQAS